MYAVTTFYLIGMVNDRGSSHAFWEYILLYVAQAIASSPGPVRGEERAWYTVLAHASIFFRIVYIEVSGQGIICYEMVI